MSLSNVALKLPYGCAGNVRWPCRFCIIVKHFHRNYLATSEWHQIAMSQQRCNDFIVSTVRESIFFSLSFTKQIDGCTVNTPLSITICNIYLSKLERDQVKPLKPKFYRRFLNNVRSRRLKNTHDLLFENLNNQDEKMTFTIETNPKISWMLDFYWQMQ